MELLGYALFSGPNGEPFTIPVIEVDAAVPPREYGITRIYMGEDFIESVAWTYAIDIYKLYNRDSIPSDAILISPRATHGSNPPISITPFFTLDNMWVASWTGEDLVSSTANAAGTRRIAILRLNNGLYLPKIGTGWIVNSYEFDIVGHDSDNLIGSIQYQSTPITLSAVQSMEIDPPIQYFYEQTSNPSGYKWRDWCNIYFSTADGQRRFASLDEITFSSTNPAITNLSVTQYDGQTFKFQIEYERPDVLVGDWAIKFSYLDDPAISATVSYIGIKSTGNIYTPGTGQGTPSQPGGGGGNFGIDPDTGQPEVSDNVANDLPGAGTNLPSTEPEVANAGLFTHYVCNNIKVAEFADWLWADNLGQAIMRDFASLFYGSPIESVISLMSYPFNVGAYAQTQTQNILLGYNDTGITASALTRTGIRIDWGTIQLTEFWGNFLDYAPHTKIELYLPWGTGFVPIDPHEVLPGSIQVITTVELAKGTCMHSVINHQGTVIATHGGVCGKQIPVTATDFSGKYVSMVTAAVSTVVAGVVAGAGTVAGAAAGGAAASRAAAAGATGSQQYTARRIAEQATQAPYSKTAGRIGNNALANSRAALRIPPNVQRNGSFSDASAGMGVQYPYLIISRPEQSVPSQYGHHYGYPSNIYASLSQLKGYTEMGEIHLDGITATDSEVEELDAILKGGVVF